MGKFPNFIDLTEIFPHKIGSQPRQKKLTLWGSFLSYFVGNPEKRICCSGIQIDSAVGNFFFEKIFIPTREAMRIYMCVCVTEVSTRRSLASSACSGRIAPPRPGSFASPLCYGFLTPRPVLGPRPPWECKGPFPYTSVSPWGVSVRDTAG